MQTFSYSDAGFAMTEAFEGRSLTAYKDVAGILTIGYGHTGPDVVEGQQISAAQADHLLHEDIAEAVACVNGAVKVCIVQRQFDALVDFCFNAGRGAFLGSTLLKDVNANKFDAAVGQFCLWVHAGGVVEPGLVRRRRAEAAMFAGETA